MIVLSRIDDKLVHGQVATTWSRLSGANRIYVVDDETAADDFLTRVMKSVAPPGTKVEVWSIETASQKMSILEAHQQIKGFVLCKGPLEFLHMAQLGVKFKDIVVGNMAAREGRTRLSNKFNCFADEQEREAFRELVKMGCNVYLQMTPDLQKIPILKCEGM